MLIIAAEPERIRIEIIGFIIPGEVNAKPHVKILKILKLAATIPTKIKLNVNFVRNIQSVRILIPINLIIN